jgi:hypothetical protein
MQLLQELVKALFPLVAYLSELEHLKPYLTVTAKES